jgi:hypothetical protein
MTSTLSVMWCLMDGHSFTKSHGAKNQKANFNIYYCQNLVPSYRIYTIPQLIYPDIVGLTFRAVMNKHHSAAEEYNDLSTFWKTGVIPHNCTECAMCKNDIVVKYTVPVDCTL